jgi:hypothetical protein
MSPTDARPDPSAPAATPPPAQPGQGGPTGPGASAPGGEFTEIPRQPVGRGPALLVLGIGAFLTVIGGIAAVLTSSSPAKAPALARASGLVPESANAALAPIRTGGQPPPAVMSHFVVPAGWQRTGHSCHNAGLTMYDCKVTLHLAAAPPSVLAFYTSELKRLGWAKLSTSSTDRGLGTELIEQIASADGYYWEVGLFVDPVTSSTAPAGGTALEVRVLERGDGD